MFDMAPILLYHAFKATTPFADAFAFVNERLRQLLPIACFSSARDGNCDVGVTSSMQTIISK